MTGYFSRIARQSGVRLANQRDVHARPMTAAPPLPPRIDRDEVVMVGPDPATEKSPQVSRIDARAIPESQKAPVAEANVRRADVGESKARESSAEAGRAISTPSAPSERPPESERPAVADSVPKKEKASDPVPLEVSATTITVPPAAEPPRQAVETEQQVDHFAETIKIISGREVSKEEASSILVREIHEWIAAGPDEPEARIEEVTKRDHLVAEPEKVGVLEREPGVVRISGELVTRREMGSEPDRQAKEVETVGLHEQTLDLSIGSINVVIEGDPAPAPPPQQPATRPADTANQTSRSPSRLRRNYI